MSMCFFIYPQSVSSKSVMNYSDDGFWLYAISGVILIMNKSSLWSLPIMSECKTDFFVKC